MQNSSEALDRTQVSGVCPQRRTLEQPGRARVAAGRPSSRELGLDLALVLARYLWKTDHLHYGYWPTGLTVELSNLKEAQENYTDFLVSHIPSGVKTVLDVGIGSGALSARLIRAGYTVDCVSPSPYLTVRARELLGPGPCIFECPYEQIQTERRYDLILFSESFQYIKLDRSIAISCDHLTPKGYLLISDYFRKDTPQDGPIKGGHQLGTFFEICGRYPLRTVSDEDITAETAPNLDLLTDFTDNVITPIKERLFGFIACRHPGPFRAVQWIFRKHLRHLETKYLSGERNGAAFRTFKSYRVFLLQMQADGRPVEAM